VLRNERAFTVAIEISSGDGSVGERRRREELIRVAMLLNELLGNDPEDLGPDFANGVHTPVYRLVKGLIGRWVNRLIQ
jgi:hypothetical protein